MRISLTVVGARRLCAVATGLVLLAACERRGGPTAADGGGPIRVGVYMDLSGQTSAFGSSSVEGLRMATDEINASGGVLGRQVELVIEDDQGRPEQAATVVTKLINQDKVVALIGEVASSNSLAAAPIAQRAKIPMITPSSTNPKVTQVGDYIFRVCFIDPFQGEVMARFATSQFDAKRAAILVDTNSDYSRGLQQYFEAAFTGAGGEIVAQQSYTQTDRDFTGQLTTIRAAKPDVLYVPGYYAQAGVIVRQARQLGMKLPILGGDGWDAPQLWELGGEALDGSYISNHYSVDDPSPRIQKFVAAYRSKHAGTVPDAMAVLAYDAMTVLADAMKRAGTTESEKLRDAIAATSNFPGVSGVISLDAERNAVKPAVVLELKNGGYVYRETIAPTGMPAAGAATTGAEATGAVATGAAATAAGT